MKALISFIIIALLIISSIVGVYYFIERPVVSKVVNINLTVSMLDEDDSFLKTGYKIYVNGDFLRDGKSITKGPILERVPIDKIITIHNYNLEDQNYII